MEKKVEIYFFLYIYLTKINIRSAFSFGTFLLTDNGERYIKMNGLYKEYEEVELKMEVNLGKQIVSDRIYSRRNAPFWSRLKETALI